MPKRDVVSWNLMIDCCLKSEKFGMARILFDKMPEKMLPVGLLWLMDISFFDEMPVRDVMAGAEDGGGRDGGGGGGYG
jgi:pentatricopeptide repeat protein